MTAPTSLYVAAAERPWFERRPGVQWKILFEDGERRTVLMRYEPGAVGDEQIFVLEGSVSDDTGTCAAGDYARRPPGCVHTVRSTGGALVLAVMSGGTESVPDGRS